MVSNYTEKKKEWQKIYYRQNKERLLAYQREWIARNPELVKKHRETWVSKNPLKAAKHQKVWHDANKEHHLSLVKKWRQDNVDWKNHYSRLYAVYGQHANWKAILKKEKLAYKLEQEKFLNKHNERQQNENIF